MVCSDESCVLIASSVGSGALLGTADVSRAVTCAAAAAATDARSAGTGSDTSCFADSVSSCFEALSAAGVWATLKAEGA